MTSVFAFIGLFCVCFSGVLIVWVLLNEILDRILHRFRKAEPGVLVRLDERRKR